MYSLSLDYSHDWNQRWTLYIISMKLIIYSGLGLNMVIPILILTYMVAVELLFDMWRSVPLFPCLGHELLEWKTKEKKNEIFYLTFYYK